MHGLYCQRSAIRAIIKRVRLCKGDNPYLVLLIYFIAKGSVDEVLVMNYYGGWKGMMVNVEGCGGGRG